jgi:hypothetical protein
MRLMWGRQIDVEERGSLDKAAVIQALQSSGDADYDSVSDDLCRPIRASCLCA